MRDPFLIRKDGINLVRIGWSFRAIATVAVVGIAAITPLTDASLVLVFISTQPLEYRRRSLQDGRDDMAALKGMSHASPSDCPHAAVVNLDRGRQLACLRIERRQH